MHEFSIAQALCEIAIEEARRNGAVRVRSLTCRVGVVRQLVPELFQTAFELSAEDPLLAGTELIVEVEGIEVACQTCQKIETIHELPLACSHCGSVDIQCRGGDDISLMSMDIDKENGDGDPGSPASGGEEQGHRGSGSVRAG